MRFSEDGICELDSITSVDECEAYKDFLGHEKYRHLKALHASVHESSIRRAMASGRERPEYHQAIASFEDSAATRHRQDLDGITKRIKEIEAHRATLEVE